DSKLDDLVVLHDAFNVLDVDRSDLLDRLRCVLDGELRRVFPALVRLRQDFNHFVNGHCHASLWAPCYTRGGHHATPAVGTMLHPRRRLWCRHRDVWFSSWI